MFSPYDLSRRLKPTSIAGCILWLSADKLNLANDSLVQTWPDRSGRGNDASQATGSARPTLKTNTKNTRPTLSLDGGDDLDVANESNFDIGTYTLFGVAVRTAGATLIAKNVLIAGATRRKLQIDITDDFQLSAGADGSSIATAATVSNYNIYCVVGRADADHDLVLNGDITNSTTTLDDTSFNNGILEIGGAFSNGAERLTGNIAEIIIYNRALQRRERTRVEKYLSRHWGVALSY